MKTYNYILFDWDGCISKTLEIWLSSYKETFAEYGQSPDDITIAQKMFGNWTGPKLFGIDTVDEFNAKLFERVDKMYAKATLSDGAVEVINTLKERGKKLALITSSEDKKLKDALKYNQLSDTFDVVLTAKDVAKHKPDPEIVYKAIELLNGNKNEAVVIGDSKSDLGAAQSASVDSILYYPKNNETFYLLEDLKNYNPTHIVTSFKEILEIVN